MNASHLAMEKKLSTVRLDWNPTPQNLASVDIGKDFMLSQGYIKNDFNVKKWAAPEFLEQEASRRIG